jgi:hypothetical protein
MRRTLCLLAVAASLAVSSAASAQQPPPNPEAVKHFLAGKAHRDAGDCKAAITELNLSIDKEESIGARYNLGFCHEKTGNKKLALVNYKKAEQLAKDKGDDRQREIGAQIRFFFEQTTHIRLALPQPQPPDLQVLIDGEALPNEEFEGLQVYFPPTKRSSYELRVTASGYEDMKLPISSDTVDRKIAVTVVMKKVGEGGPVKPEPRIIGTKWGPFQYLGLGLIAVGAVGVSYTGIAFGSYTITESDLHGKFSDAEKAASGCPSTAAVTEPNSTCGKNVRTREDLRDEYNENERFGKKQTGLWLGFAIGGAVAIGSGVLLILFAPRTDVYSTDAGATAKAPPPRPTFRVVPNVGVREQGLSLVGTF